MKHVMLFESFLNEAKKQLQPLTLEIFAEKMLCTPDEAQDAWDYLVKFMKTDELYWIWEAAVKKQNDKSRVESVKNIWTKSQFPNDSDNRMKRPWPMVRTAEQDGKEFRIAFVNPVSSGTGIYVFGADIDEWKIDRGNLPQKAKETWNEACKLMPRLRKVDWYDNEDGSMYGYLPITHDKDWFMIYLSENGFSCSVHDDFSEFLTTDPTYDAKQLVEDIKSVKTSDTEDYQKATWKN